MADACPEPERFAGRARIGRVTKELVHRIRPGEVAVIAHPDLDELAAEELAATRCEGVLNAEDSATGRLPNRGLRLLLRAGVPVVDRLGPDILGLIADGTSVEVHGARVISGGWQVAEGRRVGIGLAERLYAEGRAGFPAVLREFVGNTLAHAGRELELLLGETAAVPDLGLPVRGGPCIVVTRGAGYREDFDVLARSLSASSRPALVAVDGAADGVLARGWVPDVVFGDMDSVSEGALRAVPHIVAHATPEGVCPGAERLTELGLTHHVFASLGTSSDAAVLMVEALGAETIVAVGLPRGALDFLERGRQGMASSWLLRLRLGTKLVDVGGWSRLLDGMRDDG